MVYSLQYSDETTISSRERTNDAVDLLVRFEDLIETSDFGWLSSFRCNGGYGETETNFECVVCFAKVPNGFGTHNDERFVF